MLFYKTMRAEVGIRVRAGRSGAALWLVCSWLIFQAMLGVMALGVCAGLVFLFFALQGAFAYHILLGIAVLAGIITWGVGVNFLGWGLVKLIGAIIMYKVFGHSKNN